MKKSILKVGAELNKKELQIIHGGEGGDRIVCNSSDPGYCQDEFDCLDQGSPFTPWMCVQNCCVTA